MADLKTLKGVADKDKRMIADAEALVGPEPSTMGFVKNLFWGNLREELVFPYPQVDADENARCEKILRDLDDYMSREHPSIQIDQEQEIPRWCIDRLFAIGVLPSLLMTNLPAMAGFREGSSSCFRFCATVAIFTR